MRVESDDSVGVQSEGTDFCYDACQLTSELEEHRDVRVVRLIDLSRSVGSTRSRLNSLRVELDSHADTCVVGRNALVIHEHPHVVLVSDFDPSQPPRQAKVVDAAVRYTCRDSGDHLILMILSLIHI